MDFFGVGGAGIPLQCRSAGFSFLAICVLLTCLLHLYFREVGKDGIR